MARSSLLNLLRLLMIIICAGWLSIWILKPTKFWTKKWKDAEDWASSVVFGYYGLNFAVYTLPIIALAIVGLVYVNLQSRVPRSRKAVASSKYSFSNPLLVNSLLGTISAAEILAVFLFVLFLSWTFYVRVSNDFKHLQPIKSLKLNLWQLKYLRVATRFGLLAEACLALLLLPVLRGMAVFRVLGIQFEASVRYHVWLGTAMVIFAAIHGGSTLFIWGISNNIQEMWGWQKNGRIYPAGAVALFTAMIIWVTSLPQIRRKNFEIFYFTHHLYIIFLIFFLFHGGDRHFYTVFPGIFLFSLDRLLRLVYSGPETCILSATLFPCKTVELILPKDPRLSYASTSIIFLKVPCISVLQWHPFSISSSSAVDNSTVSVMIKCEGWWTRSLFEMLKVELETETNKIKCIRIAIEGPYGPSSMDFSRYESLLLIAGGIGITPFLSILQEIASIIRDRNGHRIVPTQIQLVYVVKKSEYISLLNSISPLLMTESSKQWNLKLKFFVTQEEKTSATVKELLNEQSDAIQTVHFSTNCTSYSIHGTESFIWLGALAGLSSITFLVCLILLNHFFVPTKKPSKIKLLASKEKTPSSVSDLFLISSFIISMVFSTMVATILWWRRLKRGIPFVSKKQGISTELVSNDARDSLEEHEIHYGSRPNFKDILSRFLDETEGSSVGVFVCGPESMKEAVASTCKQTCQSVKIKGEKKTPYISFHSLNFTL